MFSIALNILIYKYRNLTNWIFYVEIVYHQCVGVVPTDVKIMTDIAILLIHLLAFVVLYTDTGGHIIAVAVS